MGGTLLPLPNVEKLAANSCAADCWVHRVHDFSGAARIGRDPVDQDAFAELLVLLIPRVFLPEHWAGLFLKIAPGTRVRPPSVI